MQKLEKSNMRSFRVRPEHKQIILEEAERNPELITMNFSKPNARADYNRSWGLLTSRLNSLGYGEKSEDKWRRVLVDWLSSTKSKYSKLKKERVKTGGGPPTNIQLSSQEERLMAIKGYSSVEGDGSTIEIGLLPTTSVKRTTSEIDNSVPEKLEDRASTTDHTYVSINSIEIEEEIPLSVEGNVNETKKQRKDVESRSRSIQDMHLEMLTELKDIKSSLNIIAHSLKSISESLKSLYSCDVQL